MDNQELKRYDRQILLEELGISGQEKLKTASVLVVGAGGLGCPLLLYLTAAGIGKIGVIDHDEVDESNLQRQVLFHTADIGKNKAETAVAKLQLLNPYTNLQAYAKKLSPENAAALIGSYQLIIDGSDNFSTRYLVNDTCVALNKPLIFGSIFKFEGQVSVFNHKGSADYRSIYPEPPLTDEVPNCGESGVIGPLPGIIGSLMANEAIKLICEIGTPLSGKLLVYNALNNETRLFNTIRDKAVATPPDPVATKAKPRNGISGIITIDELRAWEQNNETICLIDVRESYEFEEHNIGGINIPLYDLKEKIDTLPVAQKLVFCCATGGRSKIAINLIKHKRSEEIFMINLQPA